MKKRFNRRKVAIAWFIIAALYLIGVATLSIKKNIYTEVFAVIVTLAFLIIQYIIIVHAEDHFDKRI